MQLRNVGLSVLITMLAAPAGAIDLYVSPDDDGTKGLACLRPDGSPEQLNLWIDNGSQATEPASAVCDGTGGTTPGEEWCMADYHLTADPNVTIESLTPDPQTDMVLNQQADFARFNFGDPINGVAGASRVGSLTASATGDGNINVVGEQWVDTTLTALDASQVDPLVTAGGANDADGDGFCNVGLSGTVIEDPCPEFLNSVDGINQDANDDGVPNECQCGDANGTGAYESDDLLIVFTCLQEDQEATGSCSQTIINADTNNTGAFESDDLLSIFGALNTSIPGYDLTCPARPTAGDPTVVVP